MRGEPADSAPPLEPTWAELQPLLARMKLAPPPDFDEAMYLAAHPDIAAAVAAGRFPSGFAHYVQHGRREGRLRPLAIAALTSRGEGG